MNAPAIAPPATVAEAKAKVRSIDDLLASVSASRLACFQQCRLKFYFHHVLGLKKPRSPALHVGATVHSVLEAWSRARWHGDRFSLRQLHDIYAKAWSLQEKDEVDWTDSDEGGQRQTGFKLLETYFRESGISPEEKPEAVEVSVSADLNLTTTDYDLEDRMRNYGEH
jgi:putative RecB family exonuclease